MVCSDHLIWIQTGHLRDYSDLEIRMKQSNISVDAIIRTK